MNRLFVTGTDTAVGKTVVSRALLQSFIQTGLRAVGYKPVARCAVKTADGLRIKDAQVLQSASSIDLPYEAINPCGYAGLRTVRMADYGVTDDVETVASRWLPYFLDVLPAQRVPQQ